MLLRKARRSVFSRARNATDSVLEPRTASTNTPHVFTATYHSTSSTKILDFFGL